MPIMRGATSKIILAYMGSRALRRLYERLRIDIARANLGGSWEEFRSNMASLRRAGYCIARGEVDPGRLAVAAPILNANREVAGSSTFAVDERSRRRTHHSTPDIEHLLGRP